MFLPYVITKMVVGRWTSPPVLHHLRGQHVGVLMYMVREGVPTSVRKSLTYKLDPRDQIYMWGLREHSSSGPHARTHGLAVRVEVALLEELPQAAARAALSADQVGPVNRRPRHLNGARSA